MASVVQHIGGILPREEREPGGADDADDAGQAGRRALWLDLIARGIEVLVLPAAALDGVKDLGEYWQRHRTLPRQLVEIIPSI